MRETATLTIISTEAAAPTSASSTRGTAATAAPIPWSARTDGQCRSSSTTSSALRRRELPTSAFGSRRTPSGSRWPTWTAAVTPSSASRRFTTTGKEARSRASRLSSRSTTASRPTIRVRSRSSAPTAGRATLNLVLSHYTRAGWGLNRRQIAALIRGDWELDCHSKTHASLPGTGKRGLWREVVAPRQFLRTTFHVPVNFFAYPSGDYDAQVIAAVREGHLLGGGDDESTLRATGRTVRARPNRGRPR
jgi:hypothetical protein